MSLPSPSEIQRKLADPRFSLISHQYNWLDKQNMIEMHYEQFYDDVLIRSKNFCMIQRENYVTVIISSADYYGERLAAEHVSYIIRFIQEFGIEFAVVVQNNITMADISLSESKKPFCIMFSMPVVYCPDYTINVHLLTDVSSSEPYKMVFMLDHRDNKIDGIDCISTFISYDESNKEHFSMFRDILAENGGSMTRLDFMFRVYSILKSKRAIKRAI